MSTMKNCHSPAGMHFSNAGCSNTTLTDCPGCKFGTLDLKDERTMKCADCGREYSMEQLRDLRKSPNVPDQRRDESPSRNEDARKTK